MSGVIAEESWFDDEISPREFKDELESGDGNITVWLNSPGGDCFAAAQIYNMLSAYKGKVTVKVDAIAASAATVVAMAGDEVQMSPVAMFMIHNPAMMAAGDHNDMAKAIEVLQETKESIINAYASRTHLSRAKLSKLMEDETWMDARKAVELGFADKIIESATGDEDRSGGIKPAALYSERELSDRIINKVRMKYEPPGIIAPPQGRSVEELENRLCLIQKYL